MISLYISKTTWLHRVPAWVKLASLMAASILALSIDTGAVLVLACLVAAALYAFMGRPGLDRLLGLRVVLPIVLALGVLQAWVMSIDQAVVSVARILLMIMLADLVSSTTSMQEMMRVIQPLFRPLSRLGMDVSRLPILVALVIRFVPVLIAQWQSQAEAWRARSLRRPWAAIIPPFLTMTLRRADHIAESLAARRRR